MTASIQTAYAEAEARYEVANPASRAAHETATASLPGGNTRSVLHWEPYPLCIRSAQGYTLHDVDGHAYVDLLGEYSAGVYGHSHPTLLAAITETAQRGLSYGGPHAAEARLAGLIKERFRSIERIRFTNSGTEANLMALAAAKAFTGRHRGKVIVFEGAYHGGVFVFPFGCRDVWNKGGPSTGSKYEALRALNAPHDFLVATYNDIASVDALLASSVGNEGVAAILLEPMLGSGGGVCSTPGFLAHLRHRADELGALLVFDEVMTSRMYDGGGIQSATGIRPDLTTLGKYVGGGMSFGAFGGRRDVMALFDPREKEALPHAGTFNNNVLTMNVGAVGLEHVFTPAKARELHALGDEVREKINALGSGETAARGLRVLGCGSILTFHFTRTPVDNIASPADWKSDEDARLLDLFHLEMLDEGFYLARRGYVSLSLALLEDDGRRELERFVEAVERFLGRFRGLMA
ncbi:class III aminotransferase [Xylaria bambusicola]|uniref:class III aminotransferase n=1 Tax=Xylaria bambusicola TaxID=326684 RepID=UPI002007B0B5|nr:class III aminotransferase [Xylaria bambusicola]KAI0523687.1 class III aminotransferase [Xylaria bambusicola]